jgi:transposase-like protein
MQHSFVESSLHIIEHPACPACGTAMWLIRIEPDRPDHDKRTFECKACGKTTAEVVKYR